MTARLSPRQAVAEKIEELGEVELRYAKFNLWAKDNAGNVYLELRSEGDLVYALCQLSLEDLRPLAERFTATARIAEEAIGAA